MYGVPAYDCGLSWLSTYLLSHCQKDQGIEIMLNILDSIKNFIHLCY